jgi:hypothetical protein
MVETHHDMKGLDRMIDKRLNVNVLSPTVQF